MTAQFDELLADKTLGIGVVGLGYVGLPLAVAFADAGFHVIGIDASPTRVDQLQAGQSPILDVPSSVLQRHLGSGLFCPTVDYADLARAEAIFVCVPTPFDRAKAPDLRYILDAATSLSTVLRPGHLIILESTTYPGTTEDVLIPTLERSGLKAGRDFHVAFSPERIDPGNRTFTIANTPKVVGGIDAESTRRAALVLGQVVRNGGVRCVSSPRVAELTKLLENTFRAVNIALVNELAVLCDRMGIDVWEVVEAAKTKPYGFMAFYPGTGVGGHCIPVDPYYLAWKAREYDFSTKFIEVAAETNQDMPFFAVEKIRRSLRVRGKALQGARILAIGAAFKKDIDDARNSSAIRVMEILAHQGAVVSYHDPHVPEIVLRTELYGPYGGSTSIRSVPLQTSQLRDADCVAILVAHKAVDFRQVLDEAPFVFDAVNATGSLSTNPNNVVRL